MFLDSLWSIISDGKVYMYQFKYVICLVSILFLSGNLFAQSSSEGIVTGSIKANSTNQPIENISVVLFDLGDSTIVSGTMTDAKGKFIINHIPMVIIM
jgi:hypothetical protein